jgi:hypothetical protein
MGFGSLATAFYSREMISEAILNASHGTSNPAKRDMRYFHQRLGFHKYVSKLYSQKYSLLTWTFRERVTVEYTTMCRAVSALFRQFPQIKLDVARAKNDTEPLISKVRKVRNDVAPLAPVHTHNHAR